MLNSWLCNLQLVSITPGCSSTSAPMLTAVYLFIDQLKYNQWPITSVLWVPSHHTFCLLNRVGRRIPRHQLVPGAGHAPGQPSVRLVEPHGRRLSARFCPTGHVGHLRQGLSPPQNPSWQPSRLLPLVRRPHWVPSIQNILYRLKIPRISKQILKLSNGFTITSIWLTDF